ncbi:LIM-domain binding protein-domain-containing protein [Phyllosticta capitalensis]|uniref:LIM-domain binding protein-domain-containing protein n=1 Tax=Phyllosticta capitalensis TaxID=121624 RepID=A0ABR1Z653_9PEZI
MAMQQRQQHLMRQHQAQLMQQQQQGGMMFPGQGSQSMTPQQIAAMQAANPQLQVPLPPHMRQQLAQQQAAMQQQQQQQQQQHAQAQQAHQQQLMAQHTAAMQQAASQQSNPGQGGPTPQPGPHGQPGQMRPQPPMQPGHEAQASPAQPPSQHHTPQQTQSQPQPPPPTQAPTPQQQGPQPPGPPPQQGPQPQPQNAQMQQQQQHAQQQQQQQQNQQQQQQTQQQQQAQQQRHQQLLMQQRQAQQAQAAQAQDRIYGVSILKLLNLADHLSRFTSNRQPNDLLYWKQFVGRFFTENGVFKQTLLDYGAQTTNPGSKNFEICTLALPRYFYTQFQSGLENLQLTMDGLVEKELGNSCHYVESARAKFIYWYKNGTQVVHNGKLSAMFDQADKINLLSFETQEHQQYLPRLQLDSLFQQRSPQQNMQVSPKMSKKNAPNQRNQRARGEPVLLLSELIEAPVSSWGIANSVLQFLEVGETLTNMQELFAHYHQNPGTTPAQAMTGFVASLGPQNQAGNQMPQQHPQQQTPQINMPPNGPANAQPGQRTPGNMPGGNPNAPHHAVNPQFMSPHIANLQQFPGGLNPAVNGSPHLAGQTHTPSPAQGHMQAPGLVAQHSQQGTNSSAAASANTSPNVSNKRRRSTVKTEGDDGGGDANGNPNAPKVKPSPRLPHNNKRLKGNPVG